MKKKTAYEILRIDKNATIEEIKIAYRKLSKKFHPDVNIDSEDSNEKMVEINIAYEFLTSIHQQTNGSAMSDFERVDRWKAFMARREAEGKEQYKSSGYKMKCRIMRNLEPIREENEKFMNDIDKYNDVNELKTAAHYYASMIDDMINTMYIYTEQMHRYGLPPNYSFKSRKGFMDINYDIRLYDFVKVESSFIDEIFHDEENETLFVKLNSQDVYVYVNVKREEYCNLIKAKSIGSYYLRNIRNNYVGKKCSN